MNVVKKKGFGESTVPTRNAKRFMLAFMQCLDEANGDADATTIRDFFKSQVTKLDESLLEALPLVFAKFVVKEFPEQRQGIAWLFGCFGNILQNLPLGNRWLNLELSITAYQLALQVYTREAFPEQWAMTQLNLAVTCYQRIRRDRAENIEQAIATLKMVLQIYTHEDSPKNWAGTQLNLATAYSDRIRGDRAGNLEQAIATYGLALQVYTREAFPEQWAMIQLNLGTAFRDRIRGDRAENLEQAITIYELGLQITTREALPEEWAKIHNNLATAFLYRIQGDRAENIEQAIATYKLALQVDTRKTFPEEWAKVHNNLAAAHTQRIRGDRAENIEQAITHSKLALKVYTRETIPEEWARTQFNLAAAHVQRIRGDRAENIEQAIITLELVLQVRTREAFPEKWAKTQQNLAATFFQRIRGDRAENIEQVIAHSQLASQVYTHKSFPENWAVNQAHIAGALMSRASITDNFQDLDTAITLLKKAIQTLTSGGLAWSDANYSLGNALSRHYEYSQNPHDLQQALQFYKVALDALSPEDYDREQMWQALPTTQTILGSRLVRDGKWQEGLQLLLNSVQQLSHGDDLLAHANALFQTGCAYEILSDWENARLYYRDALRLYNHLQDQLGIAQSQAGLGGALVSQGHLQKGITELLAARENYQQLGKTGKAAEVEGLYQAAQKAMERQEMMTLTEVYA